MSQAWTIRSMLAWIAQDLQALGIETPRLDAELMLARALAFDRVRIYMEMDRPLDSNELAAVKQLVVRRRKREPMAYILGRRELYRRDFEVNAAVLIPRPDTETLVERALALLPPDRPSRVLDLCTGSGAIAVTLAAERPLVSVDATDLSEEALVVARRNAEHHGVEARVTFLQGDLFGAVPVGSRYDLIVANPPYIRAGDIEGLAPEIAKYEPRLALDGGEDGLSVLRRLCAQSEDFLSTPGALLLELGAGQAEEIAACLSARPALSEVCSHRDLGGVLRVVEAHVADVSAVDGAT